MKLTTPLVALLVAFVAQTAWADFEEPGMYIFRWPEWQNGLDLGVEALGHFGKGDSFNAPPGGLMMRAQYHYWWDHLVEAHGSLGVGLSNSTFMAGIGLKVNLMEYVEDVSGKIHANGIQRGLIATLIPNFMFFFGLDYDFLSFPKPTAGQTYATSQSTLIPQLGIQWYFFLRTGWARRFYLETSGGYTNISGNNYLVPYVGLGAEFK